jgi:hypothetical protein
MGNKWSKQLKAYDDSVDFNYDAFAAENCLYSPSPYFNWIYANKSHGIPKGTGTIFFSEPKSGKSLIIQALVQQMHMEDKALIAAKKLDPEKRRHAIVFNSEMRGKFQKGLFKGIDAEYFHPFDTNRPEEIFDRFEKDFLPGLQEPEDSEDKLYCGLVALDSITSIGGTKSMDSERSVNDHLVGDKALTIGKGWEKVIPIFKRYCIPYFGVEQMRKNIDTKNPYAPTEKMAGVFSTKHAFEYFISIKRAGGKEDKVDIDGKAFENENIIDARGNSDQTGHKIYFKMEQSSFGTAGRAGVLTLDYTNGIVNTHEEIFELGKNTGIIKVEGQSYIFEGFKVRGQANFANAIKDDPKMAKAILEQVKKLDYKV